MQKYGRLSGRTHERFYLFLSTLLYTVFRARRITFFPACLIELNTKNSARWQQSCHLAEFLVFNSAFGRHRH